MENIQDKLNRLKAPMEYKWRVQSFSKSSKKASCVAYIDSRDVQDRLDEVFPAQWQSDFKEFKNNLYAGIGIKINDEWVWRWDCGSESDIEKEKGEASDAFKRAGVQWGIGRFLYSKDIVYVDSNEAKNATNRPYVVDKNGKRVFDVTEYINRILGMKKQEPVKEVEEEVKEVTESEISEIDYNNLLDRIDAIETLERCDLAEKHVKSLEMTSIRKARLIAKLDERRNIIKNT